MLFIVLSLSLMYIHVIDALSDKVGGTIFPAGRVRWEGREAGQEARWAEEEKGRK